MSASRSRRPSEVPVFDLYGDRASSPSLPADLLHIESVQARSGRYRGEISAHRHRGLHQIVWIGAGRAEISLDEWRGTGEAPAAVVVTAGVVHSFRFTAATQGHVLTLTPSSLIEGDPARAGRALGRLFARSRLLRFEAGAPAVIRLSRLFETMLGEFEAPGGADGPSATWLARALVWRLAQSLGSGDEQTPQGLREPPHQGAYAQFLALLENHYLERWPVPRYAGRLGLSTERLNRLLRAHGGRNALELIHERLAREARRRLIHADTPVARLAFELGFADPAYFTRFFRRQTGLAPSVFRRRYASD